MYKAVSARMVERVSFCRNHYRVSWSFLWGQSLFAVESDCQLQNNVNRHDTQSHKKMTHTAPICPTVKKNM